MNTEQTVKDKFQKIRAQPTTANVADIKKSEPPLLESEDRLTRQEFERRYDAMPHIKKAELIEGVVYIASLVRYESHGQPHGRIMTWLGVYCAATPDVQMADNTTVRLDPDNEVQPDALLRIEPEHGGNSQISDDDYIEGAPELIVEVAYSSAAYDLHDKMNVYRRNGIQECIVWQTYENRLDWFRYASHSTQGFRLREDEYVPLTPDESGIVKSEVFPGLHLAVAALLEGNLSEVLSELQKGLETNEHAVFVERLSEKSS